MKKLFIIFNTIIVIMLLHLPLYADSRIDRCKPYYEIIVQILESENVSSDYFYLAVCESGCKIKESSKGARGFFQLMPFTFKKFSDKDCNDIDDIICNTKAAARYIKHLEERFKDMYILIKAYNRGGTNYQRYGTTKEADQLSNCVKYMIRHSDLK